MQTGVIAETFTLLHTRFEFFWGLLLDHLKISALSISVAILLGLCIGVLISEYRAISKFVLPLVNFVYTIPAIALLGFLIPFSGIGDATAVIALIIYGLLPMVRNTHAGMDGVDPAILEAAEGMGSSRFQILTKIKLPLALPVIIAGIRNLAVMTIALAGIASFVGAGGLGVAIYRGITTNHKGMIIAGSLLIALTAILTDAMLAGLGKTVRKKLGKE